MNIRLREKPRFLHFWHVKCLENVPETDITIRMQQAAEPGF
jgi:hypothetical protein